MTTVRTLAGAALLFVAATASPAATQSTTPVSLLQLAQGPSTSPRDSCQRLATARAHDAVSARRWSDAVTLWEDALAMNGREAGHWQAYGDALYHTERYRESIAAFERAMLLGGADDEGAWNVARAYARLDRPKQALRWLGSALARGERSRQAAREEPAFGRLRGDPRFRELTETGAASRRAHPGAARRFVTVAAG
ncbi:MAG TPA: tetratricopeptide repeat protein [Gemmatimonadaceae bacterium]